MFYIGHFTVDEKEGEQLARHGYFTALTQAEDAQQAAYKFKALIARLVKECEAFRPLAAVYLEDIIELDQLPDEALITHYQSSQGEFPNSISHSLPGYSGNQARAYGHAPDVPPPDPKGQGEAGDEGLYRESTPFIEF